MRVLDNTLKYYDLLMKYDDLSTFKYYELPDEYYMDFFIR